MPATSSSANSGSRPMSTGGGLMVWIWPHLDRKRTRTPPTPRRTHYRVAMSEGCVRCHAGSLTANPASDPKRWAPVSQLY